MSRVLVCPLCGKEFVPYGRQKYCKGPHYRKCLECGKTFEVTPKYLGQQFCSKKCRGEHDRRTGKSKQNSEKAKETWKQKYGVENVAQLDSVKEKKKQTSLEHYGVEHPWLDKDVQARRQATILANHGSTNPMQDPKVVEKVQQTNLKRYGTKTPAQNRQVQKKIVSTMSKKYGTSYAMQAESLKSRYVQTLQERYGVSWLSDVPGVKQKAEQTMLDKYGVKYGPFLSKTRSSVSRINRAFSQFLTDNGVENELEFALPEKSYDVRVGNTLVEINPTYTHNSLYSHFNPDGLPKDYHVERTRYAREHSYRCIHVWDWDDWSKVLALLTPKDTLYARNCDVVQLDDDTASEFLGCNHLQGSCRGQKVCVGLEHNGRIVAVMTFGSPRYNKNYEWEILRLCFDTKYKVVGGSERMFRHFVQKEQPKSIVSYCDASKFSGNVYVRLGMSLKSVSGPRKHWYSLDDKNKPRHLTDNFLRQRGYDQIFNEHKGKGTNNELLVTKKGYLPVYDCGQMTFEWHKTKE